MTDDEDYRWSPDEDAELMRLYGTLKLPLLAKQLGRSTTGVFYRAKQLQLEKHIRAALALDVRSVIRN